MSNRRLAAPLAVLGLVVLVSSVPDVVDDLPLPHLTREAQTERVAEPTIAPPAAEPIEHASFATIGDVVLSVPGDVIAIGFHEANAGDTIRMDPLGVAVASHNPTKFAPPVTDLDHDGEIDEPGRFDEHPERADLLVPTPDPVPLLGEDGVQLRDPETDEPLFEEVPEIVLPPAPRVLEGRRTYRVMASRGRRRPATAAVDLMMRADATVFSPVDGVVVDIRPYDLEGRYPDHRIDIAPFADPSIRITVLHVRGPAVSIGSHLVAGQTVLAASPNLFPFASQIDQFVDDGPYPHVHLEVKDRSQPVLVPPVLNSDGLVIDPATGLPYPTPEPR